MKVRIPKLVALSLAAAPADHEFAQPRCILQRIARTCSLVAGCTLQKAGKQKIKLNKGQMHTDNYKLCEYVCVKSRSLFRAKINRRDEVTYYEVTHYDISLVQSPVIYQPNDIISFFF
uniref:Putative secreted protein n=1 Tax=Ixodes ricinus TaxID=34613 RepID=A0A6B0UM80_IXORI